MLVDFTIETLLSYGGNFHILGSEALHVMHAIVQYVGQHNVFLVQGTNPVLNSSFGKTILMGISDDWFLPGSTKLLLLDSNPDVLEPVPGVPLNLFSIINHQMKRGSLFLIGGNVTHTVTHFIATTWIDGNGKTCLKFTGKGFQRLHNKPEEIRGFTYESEDLLNWSIQDPLYYI